MKLENITRLTRKSIYSIITNLLERSAGIVCSPTSNPLNPNARTILILFGVQQSANTKVESAANAALFFIKFIASQ
jgi:hypothetical protein